MQFLQILGVPTTGMAAEMVLALTARVFVINLITGCTFLGSIRLAEAARARPRRFSILALAGTSAGAGLFRVDPVLAEGLAGLLSLVCLVVGLARLRTLLAERATRWNLRAPVLGRAAFGAGLLAALDGILLAQSVATVLIVPVATLVQLVRAAIDGVRGRRRSALERLAAAMVWGTAGVAILSFILYNHALAAGRAKTVIAACRRYEADKGHLPSSLEELVPAYLAAIPRAKCTAFNYSFEYSDHRSPASQEHSATPTGIHAGGAEPAAPEEPMDVSPAKARRDAVVLARSRAQGLEYDGKKPIHSLRYSTDGPFARWVYFFEQDKWVLLK